MLKTSQALMVQGTTSDAGKSVLVAGLCRVLARKGIKVAPFKSQNMALNSAVTLDGGEIGRAQAVQAYACGIEPTIHMNPVLLKPNTDIGAQVIVQGKVEQDMDAFVYHNYKPQILGKVMESFNILRDEYQTVVIEGAGSPAEINLRDRDIANMGFAEEADCPVIIVADIDRGGVFAHLYGTLDLLSESEQNRVVGFVINRFRGDIHLLTDGLDWLEKKTGKPVLGVLPYLHGLMLEAEDAINVNQHLDEQSNFKVVVPVIPRISNHTDFDPLRMHPQVDLIFAEPNQPLPAGDLIILPGTKNVRNDLDFIKAQGWDKQIKRHLRLGGKVIGICGGYQMLGEVIADPDGIESAPGSSEGLGLLPLSTTLLPQKQLYRVAGQLQLPNQEPCKISGYEIHAGITTGVKDDAPVQLNDEGKLKPDGMISDENNSPDYADQIFGTYVHGLFEEEKALQNILIWAGLMHAQTIDFEALREEGINRVADAIEENMYLDKLWPEFT